MKDREGETEQVFGENGGETAELQAQTISEEQARAENDGQGATNGAEISEAGNYVFAGLERLK